jgi:signal transduction histidine kinase
MKLPPRQQVLSSAAVLILAAILAVLAVLQYHWSRELSDAARDRMMANLQSSMMGMREDLARELSGIPLSLQPGPNSAGAAPDAAAFATRLDAWRRTASHPDLAAGLFVWRNAPGKPGEFFRLDAAAEKFAAVACPAGFERLQEYFRAASSAAAAASQRDFAHGPGGNNFFRPLPPELPWMIEEDIPALLQLQVSPSAVPGRFAGVSWIIVALNAKVLREQLLPELVQRYFAGPDGLTYDVAVLGPGPANGVIYASSPQFNPRGVSPDARVAIFGPPFPGPPDDHPPAEGEPLVAGRAGRGPFPGERQIGFLAARRLQPFRYAAQDQEWELIARHRKGSLEAALASVRQRHLTLSFGVLLVLAVTMGMIIHATRRAQRLARLQMEFVAGVSHELRTPLAVIGSAAENLADGIVEDKSKLMRYGQVIREQTRQLTHLVEQVLLFAATQQHRQHYRFVRVPPAEIAEAALANSAEAIRAAGITVERQVAPDLPEVLVDLPAATHCLQNLIANAVKYGGGARWLGVRVSVAPLRNGREIQIAVADRGIGIAASDLPRIFDPFYRSPSVRTAQLHGTGLGLALAKNIAEAMGGSLSVTSEPGKGSSFILHLPCADESPLRENAATAAPAGEQIAMANHESEHIDR